MNKKRVKQWIVFSMLVALTISNWGCSAVAAEVGARAPDFTLPTLDGGTVELNQLKGQPVVFNFWTTNCPWCRYQVPFLQEAFEEKGQEITFIGINMRESSAKVQQYAEDEGLGFTMALDSDGAVASSYNVRSIPATFFVDGQGIITYIKIGAFRTQAELTAVLDDLQ